MKNLIHRLSYRTSLLCLSSILAFVTLVLAATPALSQNRSIVFMQSADPQMGMYTHNHGNAQEIKNLTAAVEEANRIRPAFLVICGDLMNESTNAAQLKDFRDTIALLHGVPLHLVAGNHDVGNKPTPKKLAIYRHRFGRDYYEFRSGPLTGIVLDSMLMGDPDAPKAAAEQYDWLRKTLKRASRDHDQQIAIFQHKPFFVHSADEPDSYWNVPLPQRRRYLALLDKYGVRHVFAGHLHYPDYARDGDLEIIVAGATGKPLGHSVSGVNLVQVSNQERWLHKWFPLTAMPKNLLPPW